MHTSILEPPRTASTIVGERVPLAKAALERGLTREQLLRRIMTGQVAGGQDSRGRWYVLGTPANATAAR
jgi:hypothetical protein